MNIINKVTLQTLRKNRTRTLVTIIGIILSATMICAVTTFAVSFQQFLLEEAVYSDGDYYGQGVGISYDLLEKIKNDDRVLKISVAQNIGYAKLENNKNLYKPYLFIMGVDKEFLSSMPVHLKEGRMPQNGEEIILPVHVRENGGASFKIGDKITLDIGKRKSGEMVLDQNTSYISQKDVDEEYLSSELGIGEGEELVTEQTRTYTVVGYYERPGFENYSAPGYSSITLIDDEKTVEYTYDAYIKTYKAKDIYNLMSDYDLNGSTNWAILAYSGASRYDGFYSVMYGFFAIVIGIIVVGSVSLIYNAFSISVSERTKQFGLLSSIGATKKQLRKSVRFEAMFLSLIGIPIGILVGISGIGVTLYLIRDKIGSVFNEHGVSLSLHVSWYSVAAAILISFITVMISSWIPSKRAVKISAIEAIRQTNDINVKAKDVKSSKLVYKLFGFEGMLAQKYYKRNRRKYRTTVISLFISIVLFISTSAFCMYLTEASGGFESYGYDISYLYVPNSESEFSESEIYNKLSAARYVTDSGTVKLNSVVGEFDRQYISEKYLDYMKTNDIDSGETITLNIPFVFIEDEIYKQFLTDNGLDVQKFMNDETPSALVYDNPTIFNGGKFYELNTLVHTVDKVSIMKIKNIENYIYLTYETTDGGEKLYTFENEETGTEITIPADECVVEETLDIGGFTDVIPFCVSNDFVFMYPMSAMKSFDVNEEDLITKMCFKTTDHAVSYSDMENVLKDYGVGNESLADYAKQAENSRNIMSVINVFAYGFIVLISLISIANVFNTISTNINLRRREFAMLKSVGLTQKGLRKMMNFECLLYGIRSLAAGLPVSLIVTYIIYRTTEMGYVSDFKLPWLSVLIAVLSVFAVVFVTMLYSMRKINRDNPIDALKNENL